VEREEEVGETDDEVMREREREVGGGVMRLWNDAFVER